MSLFSRFAAIVTSFIVLAGLSQAADTYTVDTAHSHIGFSVKHLMISKVPGSFNKYEGTLMLEDGKIKGGEVTIQVDSIDTGNDKRDAHLKNDDFFSADKYPTITFKIKNMVERDGKQVLIGDFTIRGVTKTLELPVEVAGPIDSRGSKRIGLTGTTTINRMDFGVAHDSSGASISHEVTLDISAEATMK